MWNGIIQQISICVSKINNPCRSMVRFPQHYDSLASKGCPRINVPLQGGFLVFLTYDNRTFFSETHGSHQTHTDPVLSWLNIYTGHGFSSQSDRFFQNRQFLLINDSQHCIGHGAVQWLMHVVNMCHLSLVTVLTSVLVISSAQVSASSTPMRILPRGFIKVFKTTIWCIKNATI